MSSESLPDWERRFRAPTVTLPVWCPGAPQRCTFASNASGSWQLYGWDRDSGDRRRLTADPVGIVDGAPTPDGSAAVWFLDEKGDEFGHAVVAPFEGGGAEPLVPGIPDGWPAGIALRGTVVAVAQGEREGFAVYLAEGTTAARRRCSATPRRCRSGGPTGTA